MMERIIILLTVVWLIVMWCVIVYALRRGWGPYLKSRRCPKTRVQCRIAKKDPRQETDPFTGGPMYVHNILVFECDDGTCRDFEVHEEIYSCVEANDEGVLEYQGDLFVDFEPDKPRRDVGRIYRQRTPE